MNVTVLALALSVASALPALAGGLIVQPVPRQHIYLWGPGDLGKLRSSNPSHYARAEKIFAAADRLCRPGAGHLQYAEADGKDVSCYGMLLRTSNPPKVEIDFTLDDTRYSALVTITDDPPRVAPAR
jgi:hypothetical protein